MSHENQDYIQILRDNGYRVTPQRLIVLDAICDIGGHAEISQIMARVNFLDNTIDKSTVYRAIDVLMEVGLIVMTELENQTRVYNIAGSDHHHLVCRECGGVITISDCDLTSFITHIQAKYGFRIEDEHLAFKGLCETCQTKSYG